MADQATPVARGTAAYRRLTLAMLFAGFSTFSLLYGVQPLLQRLEDVWDPQRMDALLDRPEVQRDVLKGDGE